uniref:Uncharacterized protein n=1 Tax=Pyxicephalus adspersus TaxID=30357 RepID=A0AAV3AKY8_PYXAD|nr:TPA: hypothetical protein GDO54_014351 [Pyxicephalus adspersus]
MVILLNTGYIFKYTFNLKLGFIVYVWGKKKNIENIRNMCTFPVFFSLITLKVQQKIADLQKSKELLTFFKPHFAALISKQCN